MLDGQRKVLIQGRAGTGKTILALEFARRKLQENKSVLYLCYNRPLTEEIKLKTRNENDVFDLLFVDISLPNWRHLECSDNFWKLSFKRCSKKR